MSRPLSIQIVNQGGAPMTPDEVDVSQLPKEAMGQHVVIYMMPDPTIAKKKKQEKAKRKKAKEAAKAAKAAKSEKPEKSGDVRSENLKKKKKGKGGDVAGAALAGAAAAGGKKGDDSSSSEDEAGGIKITDKLPDKAPDCAFTPDAVVVQSFAGATVMVPVDTTMNPKAAPRAKDVPAKGLQGVLVKGPGGTPMFIEDGKLAKDKEGKPIYNDHMTKGRLEKAADGHIVFVPADVPPLKDGKLTTEPMGEETAKALNKVGDTINVTGYVDNDKNTGCPIFVRQDPNRVDNRPVEAAGGVLVKDPKTGLTKFVTINGNPTGAPEKAPVPTTVHATAGEVLKVVMRQENGDLVTVDPAEEKKAKGTRIGYVVAGANGAPIFVATEKEVPDKCIAAAVAASVACGTVVAAEANKAEVERAIVAGGEKKHMDEQKKVLMDLELANLTAKKGKAAAKEKERDEQAAIIATIMAGTCPGINAVTPDQIVINAVAGTVCFVPVDRKDNKDAPPPAKAPDQPLAGILVKGPHGTPMFIEEKNLPKDKNGNVVRCGTDGHLMKAANGQVVFVPKDVPQLSKDGKPVIELPKDAKGQAIIPPVILQKIGTEMAVSGYLEENDKGLPVFVVQDPKKLDRRSGDAPGGVLVKDPKTGVATFVAYEGRPVGVPDDVAVAEQPPGQPCQIMKIVVRKEDGTVVLLNPNEKVEKGVKVGCVMMGSNGQTPVYVMKEPRNEFAATMTLIGTTGCIATKDERIKDEVIKQLAANDDLRKQMEGVQKANAAMLAANAAIIAKRTQTSPAAILELERQKMEARDAHAALRGNADVAPVGAITPDEIVVTGLGGTPVVVPVDKSNTKAAPSLERPPEKPMKGVLQKGPKGTPMFIREENLEKTDDGKPIYPVNATRGQLVKTADGKTAFVADGGPTIGADGKFKDVVPLDEKGKEIMTAEQMTKIGTEVAVTGYIETDKKTGMPAFVRQDPSKPDTRPDDAPGGVVVRDPKTNTATFVSTTGRALGVANDVPAPVPDLTPAAGVQKVVVQKSDGEILAVAADSKEAKENKQVGTIVQGANLTPVFVNKEVPPKNEVVAAAAVAAATGVAPVTNDKMKEDVNKQIADNAEMKKQLEVSRGMQAAFAAANVAVLAKQQNKSVADVQKIEKAKEEKRENDAKDRFINGIICSETFGTVAPTAAAAAAASRSSNEKVEVPPGSVTPDCLVVSGLAGTPVVVPVEKTNASAAPSMDKPPEKPIAGVLDKGPKGTPMFIKEENLKKGADGKAIIPPTAVQGQLVRTAANQTAFVAAGGEAMIGADGKIKEEVVKDDKGREMIANDKLGKEIAVTGFLEMDKKGVMPVFVRQDPAKADMRPDEAAGGVIVRNPKTNEATFVTTAGRAIGAADDVPPPKIELAGTASVQKVVVQKADGKIEAVGVESAEAKASKPIGTILQGQNQTSVFVNKEVKPQNEAAAVAAIAAATGITPVTEAKMKADLARQMAENEELKKQLEEAKKANAAYAAANAAAIAKQQNKNVEEVKQAEKAKEEKRESEAKEKFVKNLLGEGGVESVAPTPVVAAPPAAAAASGGGAGGAGSGGSGGAGGAGGAGSGGAGGAGGGGSGGAESGGAAAGGGAAARSTSGDRRNAAFEEHRRYMEARSVMIMGGGGVGYNGAGGMGGGGGGGGGGMSEANRRAKAFEEHRRFLEDRSCFFKKY